MGVCIQSIFFYGDTPITMENETETPFRPDSAACPLLRNVVDLVFAKAVVHGAHFWSKLGQLLPCMPELRTLVLPRVKDRAIEPLFRALAFPGTPRLERLTLQATTVVPPTVTPTMLLAMRAHQHRLKKTCSIADVLETARAYAILE